MLSKLQEDILIQIEKKWKEYPSLRFGQLISNMLDPEVKDDIFYLPNNIVINMIAEYPSLLWHTDINRIPTERRKK